MLRLDLLFFMLGAVLASPEMAETIGLESGGWYLSRGEDREARLSLSSDDAEFITGQVLSVSGGLTMHG